MQMCSVHAFVFSTKARTTLYPTNRRQCYLTPEATFSPKVDKKQDITPFNTISFGVITALSVVVVCQYNVSTRNCLVLTFVGSITIQPNWLTITTSPNDSWYRMSLGVTMKWHTGTFLNCYIPRRFVIQDVGWYCSGTRHKPNGTRQRRQLMC